MKVGIDLSSTNTGLVILDDNNKLIWHGNFQLWDKSSQKPNRVFVREIFDIINCKRLNETNITIGVELSDFGNWKYADRFNFIAGALYQEHYCQDWGMMGDFICFNSNEWQRFIWDIYTPFISSRTIIINHVKHRQYAFNDVVGTCDWVDKRKMLKFLSRLWTKETLAEYKSTWTEDECDAYCIAYFLPQLRDRTQMHQEVKVRNKNKAKSEKQALRDKLSKEKRVNKLKDIVIKYKSMEKLTKAQQRALEKANKELKELK